MKDNYVILDEIAYDNGGYETIINTPIGTFTGCTEPDEMDAKYPSIYHAAEISLAKALRKYADTSVNILKHDIKMLSGMIKQACDCALSDDGDCEADLDNASFRIMNGTLKQKKKELKLWENRIEGLTKNIVGRIAARDKIVAKYIEKDKAE
jgi:hypothetical protein